jgi:hypothetical protein
VATWELIREIVKNLGTGWEASASGPQEMGFSCGLASGPGGMRLFFIGARTEKFDPCMERSCPPLGWMRVDGRFSYLDEPIHAQISITLLESLTAMEMANEIIVRFFPLYADFLGVIAKHHLECGRKS